MIFSYGITLLILCPLIFLSAFIDSIAGGGGLISLPAYLFAGLPIHNASATNKFPASMGTATAVINYIREGAVDFSAAIPASLFAVAGSALGTRLALFLSPRVLQICLMIILPIAGIFILTRGGAKTNETKPEPAFHLKLLLASLTGLVCGAYDGFFGPGTGMFITLSLIGLLRLPLLKAVGTTKVINLASNAASMITWLLSGKILFPIAIPCAVCGIAGGFLGSRAAIKSGKRFIRPVLALVAVLLFIKILVDLIKSLA